MLWLCVTGVTEGPKGKNDIDIINDTEPGDVEEKGSNDDREDMAEDDAPTAVAGGFLLGNIQNETCCEDLLKKSN